MDERIEFCSTGYELTYRRFAYSFIHEVTHRIANSKDRWVNDVPCRTFSGNFVEFQAYGWPKAQLGGRIIGPVNGIAWKQVYMDDLFLCPKCGRFHLSKEEADWSVLTEPEENWERFVTKVTLRFAAKEFYYKQCSNRSFCESFQSAGLKELAKQERLLSRRANPQQPIIVPPKVEIADEAPVESKTFVYLIEGNSLYKIGIATNVSKRKASLQTSSPFELKIVKVWETAFPKKVEKHLHTHFKSHRVRGEWFRLPSNEVESLLQIANLDEMLSQQNHVE